MKSKVPIIQVVYFCILFFFIVVRCNSANDVEIWIGIVNYVSMLISFSSNWFNAINEANAGRERNICVAVFVMVMAVLSLLGCVLTYYNKFTSQGNDIITLLALLFCICNTIFEKVICKIFSLRIENAK